MAETSSFYLESRQIFTPDLLFSASSRLPLDGDFVVIRGFTGGLPLLTPNFQRGEGDSVSLSLGKPFGFKRYEMGQPECSQLTDGIVIEPTPEDPHLWQITTKTEQPLSSEDRDIFNDGIDTYMIHAGPKITTAIISAWQSP